MWTFFYFYLTLVIGVVIGMIVAGLLHMSSQSDGETPPLDPERLPDRRRRRRSRTVNDEKEGICGTPGGRAHTWNLKAEKGSSGDRTRS